MLLAQANAGIDKQFPQKGYVTGHNTSGLVTNITAATNKGVTSSNGRKSKRTSLPNKEVGGASKNTVVDDVSYSIFLCKKLKFITEEILAMTYLSLSLQTKVSTTQYMYMHT